MNTDERILYHYPRRFRWRSFPSGAALYVNGRAVGSVLHFERRSVWSALLYAHGRETLHRRRCDAKRAVEVAAVNEEMRRAALRGTETV